MFFKFYDTFHAGLVLGDHFSLVKLRIFGFQFEFVFFHFKVMRTFFSLQLGVASDALFSVLEN